MTRVLLLLLIAALGGPAFAHDAESGTDAGTVFEKPTWRSAAEAGVGRLVPDLEFSPITGKPFSLSDLKQHRAVVVVFTSTSCPVARRYGRTLAALEKAYAPRGVRFVFVNTTGSDGIAEIQAAVADLGLVGPYVRDRQSTIARALGANSTTEAFVLDAARTLVYRGAVDDQYGVGYSRQEPRERYLADALDALLDGKRPEVAATSSPGCVLETAGVPAAADLTYHARISRILQQNCVECHREGGVGPFSLDGYRQVLDHSGMIRRQVEKNVMPPWFAAPSQGAHSPWANDRSLRPDDKAALLAWLTGEKKEGDPRDAPVARRFPVDWEIGTPDAVVRLPEPLKVKADGIMPYQNVEVATGFTEDKWVTAIEVRPTARQVVHHVLVFVVPAGATKNRHGVREGDAGGGNYFGVYVPGNHVLRFPEGMGKRVPAGASLRFQIHYTPNGTATEDQTAVGLIFAKTPPRYEVRVAAVAAPVDIPPGDPDYRTVGQLPVPFDARILSFMPHMHVRGKAFRYELRRPGQEPTLLLDVPRYDFNWQLQYRLAEAVDAPAGSRIVGTAWYDNSENNPANPDPAKRVKWGEQTYDEMMLGYLEYYLPGADPKKGNPPAAKGPAESADAKD